MRNHCFLPGPIATGLVLLRLRIECVCARNGPRSAQAETREIPSSSWYDESGEPENLFLLWSVQLPGIPILCSVWRAIQQKRGNG